MRKVYREKGHFVSPLKDEKKLSVGLISKWLVGLLLVIKQKTRGYIVPSYDPTSHREMIHPQISSPFQGGKYPFNATVIMETYSYSA